MAHESSASPSGVSEGTDNTPARTLQLTLVRVMKVLIARADVGSPLQELPLLQVRCLHILSHHETQPMNEIAHLLEVDMPGLSRIVDRLEKRGLVARQTDPTNRRVVHVKLTDTARSLLLETRQARLRRIEACLHRLEPAQQAQVLQALELLADTAEAIYPPPSPVAPSLTEDPVVQLLTRYPRTRRGKGAIPSGER